MKLCQVCGQSLAETITSCPSCGAEIKDGRKYIDDYRIVEVLEEGHASTVCRAVKDDTQAQVMIRIFKPKSEIDEEITDRLVSRLEKFRNLPGKGFIKRRIFKPKSEIDEETLNRFRNRLEKLKKLPKESFVEHYEIKRSVDGLWYKVSEWVPAESWSTILASGLFDDYQIAFDLFHKIAAALDVLHNSGHFIPHLNLNDILVVKGKKQEYNIKIDVKISRFLDPEFDLPSSLLTDLLNCHPDIVNNRPLDYRSDIWALGKVFLELLTANIGGAPQLNKIESLAIPQDAKILLKVMLSDDPVLRPQTMADVANTLLRLKKIEPETIRRGRFQRKSRLGKEVKGLENKIRYLAFSMIAIIIFGVTGWFYFGSQSKDVETVLAEYANTYASSVAFVMVDYALKSDDVVVYQNRIEGTAFLVDSTGYLFTNRHVACPWLEDRNFYMAANRFKSEEKVLHLDYRIYLWFEGAKAYKRLQVLAGSNDLTDIYSFEAAYRSDGKPKVFIAGIAKAPVKMGYLAQSPLRNDFAVLKIDQVPEGLVPLSLETKKKARDIPKLSPVITLGFPLGRRTQADSVNVSVTRGNVRRTFENVIQVDTSIYGGNSGGPIIDSHGQVIGIATAIAVDQLAGIVPVITPLSDMGLILPIEKAVAFLEDLKKGQVKWNGIPDFSLQSKIESIKEKAIQGLWHKARLQADHELKFSLDPFLFMTAGMMHFGDGDHLGARDLFRHSLSLDSNNNEAKLMLYLIDWLADISVKNPYRKELITLNWRSSDEFMGYLLKVFEGMVDTQSALEGWNSKYEKSWISYAVALKLEKKGEFDKAEKRLKESFMSAGKDDWILFLALAQLHKMQIRKLGSLRQTEQTTSYLAKLIQFRNDIKKEYINKKSRQEKLNVLLLRLLQPYIGLKERKEILLDIYKIDKDNKQTLVWLAYLNAMDDDLETALQYANDFLESEGWESRARLSAGLLKLEILHKIKPDEKDLIANLKKYDSQTSDTWYKSITKTLMGELTADSLMEMAKRSPENLVTAHTALGLWFEGKDNLGKAINHYQEALGSYLEMWWEYEFARGRIIRLRMVRESKTTVPRTSNASSP